MAFNSWTNRRWIRVRYTYDPEERYAISGDTAVWTFQRQTRTAERLTARCDVAGVDSQTVLADIGETLPDVYIPTGAEGGGSDSSGLTLDSLSGSSGWTEQAPEVEDVPGGTRVTVTWARIGEFADVSGAST